MALDKLSAEEILHLVTKHSDTLAQIDVSILDSVNSTNDYMFEKLKLSNLTPMSLVLAEQQQLGKGRHGRVWVSPPGNIYLSIYYSFDSTVDKLYGLSLVVGLGVVRVLRSYHIPEIKLKWPNDIFWHDRKLGGILVETKPNKHGTLDVVIGIGLNVQDIENYSEQINQKFVSLENITQHKIYRNKLVALLIAQLSTMMKQFASDGFDAFVDEWHSVDALGIVDN